MKIQIVNSNRPGLKPGDILEGKETSDGEGYEVTFEDHYDAIFGGGDQTRVVTAFVNKKDVKILA